MWVLITDIDVHDNVLPSQSYIEIILFNILKFSLLCVECQNQILRFNIWHLKLYFKLRIFEKISWLKAIKSGEIINQLKVYWWDCWLIIILPPSLPSTCCQNTPDHSHSLLSALHLARPAQSCQLQQTKC